MKPLAVSSIVRVVVARYYDPATGQFISRDSAVALTQAPYSYADNDPLNAADPTGMWPWGSPSSGRKRTQPGNVIASISETRAGVTARFGLNGWKRSTSLRYDVRIYQNGHIRWEDGDFCPSRESCTGLGPESINFTVQECGVKVGDNWDIVVTGYGPGAPAPEGIQERDSLTFVGSKGKRDFWDHLFDDFF